MFIKEIKLNNFRNYDSLNLSVSPGINVIYGKNGYGKTNILEAMFLCCIGKSFRTNHDVELIKNDRESYDVKVKIDENMFSSIEILYNRKKVKAVKVDGVYIEKLRFLMGCLNGIIFSPETLSLINDGPSERRRFLDIAICQISSDYFFAVSTYNRYVAEKTALITNAKFKSQDETTLSVYNENIAKYGALIFCKRYGFMKNVSNFASVFYNEISDNKEKLEITYQPACASVQKYLEENEEINQEEVEKLFLEELNAEKNIKREKEYGKCFIGPHRDDFDCLLNGFSMKSFASQGQKRSAVIAIKLSELEIVKKASGKTPILFLDDVLSELDRERKNKILELTKNYQTFITCTDRDIAEELFKGKNAPNNNINYINVESLR